MQCNHKRSISDFVSVQSIKLYFGVILHHKHFAKITTMDLFNLFNTYKIDSTPCWHAMLSCYVVSNKCFINIVPNPDFSDGYLLLLSVMSC